MMFAGDDWSEDWDYDVRAPWVIGTGYGAIEPQQDVIDALYAVVEEVTGKAVARPTPRRIGFY
ncbi:hypothetical protein KDW07_26870 [Burkholderia dolosa]|uniref:hypothetical protein n=1 Tax=Burkholderia dolosa TaxID=152500 RepID=UPI001BA2EE48|nr:hypothetical protein [Burkholderia dolosa]MBR8460767.1 hypothetical protein [Burkholderia dolosa]